MSENKNNDEFLNWVGLPSWEQQICDELEKKEDSYNQILLSESEAGNKKVWSSFQNAAHCVAIMYKGATSADSNQHSLWIPFQSSAGSLTTLYKDSQETMKKCTDIGIQSGYHKRGKELAHWIRKKRHFRREELLSFLSGKSPPHRTNYKSSPRSRMSLDRGRISPRLPSSTHHQGLDDNLNTFREALGIHGPPVSTANNLTARRRGSTHTPELQNFMIDEFARHKRPAPSHSPIHESPMRRSSSPHDAIMDSPQQKRFRYM